MAKKDEDIYRDDFLKKMFKDVKLEQPSEDFTNRVMDGVMQEWLTQPVVKKKRLSWKGWLGMIGFALIVAIVLLITDVRKLIQMTDSPLLNHLDNSYLQPIHDVFAQLFVNLANMPVIVYIIFIALLFLSVLDRIFGKVLQLR
ncbi:MAG: hypothetical protein ACEPOZ_00745 [Marinifilaceae bacterium]